MIECITLICCILIIIIILTVVLISIAAYYHIKTILCDTIDDVAKFIPSNIEYEYTDINYNKLNFNKIYNELDDIKFNKLNETFTMLTMCNMSSYNLYGKYNPRLSSKIKYMFPIGSNGYAYSFTHNNNDFYILSFRGTRTGDELINDFDSIQVPYIIPGTYNELGMVHRGFYRIWKDSIHDLDYFFQHINSNKILITGHSLGSASAIFSSLYLKHKDTNLNILVYNIAPPRIGNHIFTSFFNQQIRNNYSIINIPDIVPNLPPVTLPTIGNTWIYDNYLNVKYSDIQTGSISLNHRLDLYLFAINSKFVSSLPNFIWMK